MSRALALLRSSHPEPGGAVTAGDDPAGGRRRAPRLARRRRLRSRWRPPSSRSAGSTTGWTPNGTGAAGRRDKPVAAGAVSGRTVGIAGLLAALAVPLLGAAVRRAAGRAASRWPRVFALLYDWPLKSHRVLGGALPGGVRAAAGVRGGRAARASGAAGLAGRGGRAARRRRALRQRAARPGRRRGHRGARPAAPARRRPAPQLAAAVLLLAATLTLVFGPPGPPSWAGWAAAAAAVVVLPLGWYAGPPRRPAAGWPCSAR